MATAGRWEDLHGVRLHPSILSAMTDEFKFPTMTPVQAAAIPPLLSCKDVCVEAETGSGKTLSFVIPIAQMVLFGRTPRTDVLPEAMSHRRDVRAIVLLPTRELATQVHLVTERLFRALPGDIKPVPLIGGVGAGSKSSSKAGPDEKYANDHRIVIATPGRLSAALCTGALQIRALDVLVMDEADRLLDMGFAVTVTDILTRLPKQRRTGMYSATQTREVDALARAGMRNPVRVAVRVHRAGDSGPTANTLTDGGIGSAGGTRRARIPVSVKCFYRVVSPRDKLSALLQLLAKHPDAKMIVYLLTCACVEHLRYLPLERMLEETACKFCSYYETKGNDTKCEKSLENDKTGAQKEKEEEKRQEIIDGVEETKIVPEKRKFYALHGKMSQKKRERSLSQFAASTSGVLLCTDVAARGIDIPDVDWVLQMDVPQDPDAYIHRVGRTGRLGREGKALLFVGEWESNYIDFLRVRKCGVTEWKQSDDEIKTEVDIRALVKDETHKATVGDRAVLEASEKAFLSFVRAYKEHKCSYLLKVNEVDFNSVADSFGLLRLPRFHEFKKVREKIEPRNSEGVCIRDIKFKDKNRERRRQQDIEEAIANRSQRREALQSKSKKKKKKRKRGRGDDNAEKNDGENKNQQIEDDSNDDEDDFSMEAMQLRKLKRGKLTQTQFDQLTGYDKL